MITITLIAYLIGYVAGIYGGVKYHHEISTFVNNIYYRHLRKHTCSTCEYMGHALTSKGDFTICNYYNDNTQYKNYCSNWEVYTGNY